MEGVITANPSTDFVIQIIKTLDFIELERVAQVVVQRLARKKILDINPDAKEIPVPPVQETNSIDNNPPVSIPAEEEIEEDVVLEEEIIEEEDYEDESPATDDPIQNLLQKLMGNDTVKNLLSEGGFINNLLSGKGGLSGILKVLGGDGLFSAKNIMSAVPKIWSFGGKLLGGFGKSKGMFNMLGGGGRGSWMTKLLRGFR